MVGTINIHFFPGQLKGKDGDLEQTLKQLRKASLTLPIQPEQLLVHLQVNDAVLFRAVKTKKCLIKSVRNKSSY